LQDPARADGDSDEPAARRSMNPRLLFIGAIVAVLIATMVFKVRVFVVTGKYALVLLVILIVVMLLMPSGRKR
jgi:hypothetical protein